MHSVLNNSLFQELLFETSQSLGLKTLGANEIVFLLFVSGQSQSTLGCCVYNWLMLGLLLL